MSSRPLLLPLSLLVALLLTAGCSELLTDAPPVADSTMVNVLTQMHLAKARSQLYDDLPPGVRDSVLQRHDLDRTSFERALDYYTDHPKTYAAVYDSVVDRLSEQKRPTREKPRAEIGERREE